MKKTLPLLAAVLCAAAAGCGGHSEVKMPDPAQRNVKPQAARARSEAAPGRVQTMALADDAPAPTIKILNKDAAGCTWIESEATITVGHDDTRPQARATAVAEARKMAMQDFLGVEVRSRNLDFQQETLRDQKNVVERMLLTTRRGRILKEQVINDGFRSLGAECRDCRFYVQLRTCIMESDPGADKEFQAELGISQTNFVQGNEATIEVTANRDCYIYLYDVGMDWETSLIVPNELFAEVKLKAGQSWTYPDEATRKRGVRLVAQMPDEKTDVSAETIRVIASKTPIPKKLYDPTEGGFLGALQRINGSRLEWTEDAQAFTIRRK